jgi:hypothetical protein
VNVDPVDIISCELCGLTHRRGAVRCEECRHQLGIEPDWPQLEALDRILAHLALAGGKSAAAPLTLQGWVAWCRGRGSVAAAYYCRALRAQPRYRLAGLLLELDQRGTICGWAARKEAAWQKFSNDPDQGTGRRA